MVWGKLSEFMEDQEERRKAFEARLVARVAACEGRTQALEQSLAVAAAEAQAAWEALTIFHDQGFTPEAKSKVQHLGASVLRQRQQLEEKRQAMQPIPCALSAPEDSLRYFPAICHVDSASDMDVQWSRA